MAVFYDPIRFQLPKSLTPTHSEDSQHSEETHCLGHIQTHDMQDLSCAVAHRKSHSKDATPHHSRIDEMKTSTLLAGERQHHMHEYWLYVHRKLMHHFHSDKAVTGFLQVILVVDVLSVPQHFQHGQTSEKIFDYLHQIQRPPMQLDTAL
jgi:hypothetical protein